MLDRIIIEGSLIGKSDANLFFQTLDGVAYHLLGQLRVHRKREQLAHLCVGNRKVSRLMTEICVSFKRRKGDRIMNAGGNSALCKSALQSLAVINAHNIEMEDRLCE